MENKRRKYNQLYLLHDNVLNEDFEGTLKEISFKIKVGITTIVMAMNRGNLIFRRYKITPIE